MESLEGKVLAIDVSIWVIQFMNVLEYRQNNPDSVPAPTEFHVIDGFLRRICKLLYFGIKPVFVFDGSTPSIKKKTLMMRRKLRHKQQVNYGKAAEKLLHNIVKETLIKQLQADNQRVQEDSNQQIEQEIGEEEGEQQIPDADNLDETIHLTKLLLDKHSTLLQDHDIDIEIFQSLDLEEQYEVID